MKKSFIIAIAAMVLATTVAVVSCKKDDQNETPTGRVASAADYAPGRIDDMNAYLKDFKGRMRNPSRDENTMLSLEEAAWHLSSVANYDFGNASAEFTDIRFDTLHCQVNVTDGMVSMADLGAAYAQAADAIANHMNRPNSEGENARFIDASIADDGRVTLSLMMVFLDHVWYFLEDTIWTPFASPYADSVCHVHFSESTRYRWDSLGITELQRVLNLFESHPPFMGWTYYTATRNITFAYPDCPDPYGSPFKKDMRTYASNYARAAIPFDDMCYCLDSYLGLGYDYLHDNPYVEHEHVVGWLVDAKEKTFSGDHLRTYYHELTVKYGQLHPVTPGPIPY